MGTRLKEVYQAVPAGRRPLGRPKIRWCDQVVEDVTRCGGSVDLAEDRVAWKRLIDEAKNRLRFVTPRQTGFVNGPTLQVGMDSRGLVFKAIGKPLASDDLPGTGVKCSLTWCWAEPDKSTFLYIVRSGGNLPKCTMAPIGFDT
ncbi:hypothetical protein J6590_052274 [Homalodisca vitripennis]|nr:hypothetical protein J6590_052274 [Homalodisca vitripennis]